MKRIMSIAAIALFVAGSSALACDTCGCKAKKADDKKPASCAKEDAKSCSAEKKGDASCKKECTKAEKKCGADCKKACCAPKADAKK